MPKWLLIFMGVLVIASGCYKKQFEECQESLGTCQDELAECIGNCDPESTEAAFKLVLAADSYGTFLPVNNQFSEDGAITDPFYSGYFIQLATFNNTLGHGATKLVLTLDDEQVLPEIPRSSFKWLDIVCKQASAPEYPEVLDFTSAVGWFLPDSGHCGDPDLLTDCGDPVNCIRRSKYLCDGRLLHKDMVWDSMSLVTFWKGASGVSVDTTTLGFADHSHDQFTFKSKEPCEVRFWGPDGSSITIEGTDDLDNPVVMVQVKEIPGPVNHGGVHHPPWP